MRQKNILQGVAFIIVVITLLTSCQQRINISPSSGVSVIYEDIPAITLNAQSEPIETSSDIFFEIEETIIQTESTEPLLTETNLTEIITEPSPEEPITHTHTFTLTKTDEATCTQSGVHVYQCNCGIIKEDTINALGHDYQLTISESPTYVLPGNQIYTCTYCGKTRQNKLPTLHTVADTDMCGRSLVEQGLPHSSYTQMMQDVFDIYHSKPHIYEADKHNKYLLPVSRETFNELLNSVYQYFWHVFTQYFIIEDDGSVYLNIYYDERRASQNEVAYEYAQQIIQDLNIDNTVSQKEAIIRINNWICDNKYYDYDAKADDAKINPSLYSSLFKAGGVCHNYAFAFQILCLTAGIECHYYSSKTMNHAWNKIYFSDDSYLWVDVTWNDIDKTESRTKYLLIDDNMLLKDHTL